MNFNSKELLEDLSERTKSNIIEAKAFRSHNLEELNWRPFQTSWSVLECLEHLNLYGDFYIPQIEKVIKKKKYPGEKAFKSGYVGNYFARMMLPGENLKKMKTFKNKNPLGSKLDKSTTERFIDQQNAILDLLSKASKVSLGRTKTGISISRFIRLKLGDILRVVIFHNQRHILQAQRVLKEREELAVKAEQ